VALAATQPTMFGHPANNVRPPSQQCSATQPTMFGHPANNVRPPSPKCSTTQPTPYFEKGIGCLINPFCQIKQKLNLIGQIFSLDKLPN
jgi:hypothetical protein